MTFSDFVAALSKELGTGDFRAAPPEEAGADAPSSGDLSGGFRV